MNAKELGKLMGCAETGVSYEKLYQYAGALDAYEKSASYANESTDVLKATYKILDTANVDKESDLYRLVKAAYVKSSNGGWDENCVKVVEGIHDFCGKVAHAKGHVKMALKLGTTGALLSGGLKSVAAIAAMTGIGMGTLYWALKRDAKDEALPNEMTKNRIDIYHDMSRDLETSIKNKVGY